MQRENYYILLELPFDPPATDPAQIKAAIHTKHQQWTQQLDDNQLRSTALKQLEQLEDIERIMLDDTLRATEAEQAKALRETTFTRFTAELKVLEAKGYILPRELTAIAQKYFPFGIRRGDIHREMQVPVMDSAPKTVSETNLRALSQETMRSIRGNLKILDTANLYTFLEVEPTDSSDSILTAAQAKKQAAVEADTRSAEVFAAEILAESALSLFADNQQQQQYDLALTVSDYPELNDLIDDEYQRAGFVSSEALVRLVNFGMATYQQATVLEMEDYIRRYCTAYGISVDFMHHHVQCPNCEEMNPGDAVFCTHCAAPLEGFCPQCDAPFHKGEPVCSNCGFLIGSMGKALEQFSIAETALVEGSWSSAQRAVEHAATFWPGHPKLELLQEKIDDLEHRNMDFLQVIDDYIEQKRYYAAQELLEQAEERQIRIPSATKLHITDTITEFEKNLATLRSKEKASYEALHTMLSYVSDSIDLERMLAQYPPEPPSRITVVPSDEGIQVEWNTSQSSGFLQYVLVRKESSVPLTAYDGDVLYEGTHHSFLDENVPALRNYYYSVFVKRGHSYSDIGAVSPLPVRIVPELKNLRAVPADGGAQLTWEGLPELTSVDLWRKLGGEPLTKPDDGMALENDRLDGFTDMKLRNDVEYWYFIRATYQVGGEQMTSRGVSLRVTPQALVSPIDQWSVGLVEGSTNAYRARWENAEDHDIMLLYTSKRPDHYLGEVAQVTDLLYNHQRLTLENLTPTDAHFTLDFLGEKYIFPVSVQGKVAVIGTTRYLTNIPTVTDPTHVQVDDDLYLNFTWPDGPVGEVVVAWKHGEFPTSLSEEGITTVRCSRRQYQLDSGVHIPGLDRGGHYFSIFSTFESGEGELLYSKGIPLFVDNSLHQEIRYQVKHSKPLFSSKYNTTITVWSEDEFVIPKAVLVGKVGQLPLRITDGTPYFEVEHPDPTTGSVILEYKTDKLPDDLYLRLFFYDTKEYSKYRPLPEKTVKLTK